MLHTCTQHAAKTSIYTATPHASFHHSFQTSGQHKRAAAAAAVVQTAAVPEPTPGLASQTAAVKLDPELKAKHKRPDGWTAPGPQPWAAAAVAAASAGSAMDPDLCPGPNETLSYLTGDWRLLQLRDGHRCASLCCVCLLRPGQLCLPAYTCIRRLDCASMHLPSADAA